MGRYTSLLEAWVSVCLYFGSLVYALIQFRTTMYKRGHGRHWFKHPAIFPGFLAASFALRLVWILLVGIVDINAVEIKIDMAAFVVNKIAFATFFTAYSFVVSRLTSLRQLLVKQSHVKRHSISRGWTVFLVGNTIAYVLCCVIIALRAILPDECGGAGDHPHGKCFHYGVVAFSSGYLILGICFAVFVASTIQSVPCSEQQRLFLRRLLIATSIIVALFAMRFAVFLWEPLTERKLPAPVYPYLFYEVPELISGWILMTAMSFSVRETRPTLLSLISRSATENSIGGSDDDSLSNMTLACGGLRETPAIPIVPPKTRSSMDLTADDGSWLDGVDDLEANR